MRVYSFCEKWFARHKHLINYFYHGACSTWLGIATKCKSSLPFTMTAYLYSLKISHVKPMDRRIRNSFFCVNFAPHGKKKICLQNWKRGAPLSRRKEVTDPQTLEFCGWKKKILLLFHWSHFHFSQACFNCNCPSSFCNSGTASSS